jgi:hypothetical protein
MAGTSRDAGIPVIRSRIDATEEAKEWNKMREAVTSIYESGTVISESRVAIPLIGFRPVARVDVDAGASVEAGVGITAGTLRFLESSAITEAAGDRNEAVEVMPTLDDTALDADPTPREYLAAGDHEAWVVFKELGSTNGARIVFAVEDAGPGALDRDEKAERLATFEVTYPGGTDASGEVPGVTIKEQFIRDELAIWTERHQFKARKTDDDKIKIDQGFVVWQKGPSDPLVSESFDIDESAEITIPGASGSIWLSVSWQVAQHSTSTASSGTVLTNYRLESLSSAAYSFRAAAPTRGVDTGGVFYTGTLWYEIAKVEIVGGDAFVTDQIINGPIYVNELSDSFLS